MTNVLFLSRYLWPPTVKSLRLFVTHKCSKFNIIRKHFFVLGAHSSRSSRQSCFRIPDWKGRKTQVITRFHLDAALTKTLKWLIAAWWVLLHPFQKNIFICLNVFFLPLRDDSQVRLFSLFWHYFQNFGTTAPDRKPRDQIFWVYKFALYWGNNNKTRK